MTNIQQSPAQPAVVLCSVDRFSVLDGAIVAVGWCPHGVAPRISIDGEAVAQQTCVRYSRPDVVAVHGQDYAMSGFRIAGVVVDTPDGAEIAVRIGDRVIRREDIPVKNDVHWIRDRF